VHNQHFQYVQQVERGDVGVLGQDDYAKAQVPRVLRVVFSASAGGVDRLAENFLQPITLRDELDLLGQPQRG
jgi:hypothetical protein